MLSAFTSNIQPGLESPESCAAHTEHPSKGSWSNAQELSTQMITSNSTAKHSWMLRSYHNCWFFLCVYVYVLSTDNFSSVQFSHSVVSDSLRPMDCSPPGSSVHGLFQARILEWVAIFFFRGSSRLRDWTHVSWVSCIAGGFFTQRAMREALIFLRTVFEGYVRYSSLCATLLHFRGLSSTITWTTKLPQSITK